MEGKGRKGAGKRRGGRGKGGDGDGRKWEGGGRKVKTPPPSIPAYAPVNEETLSRSRCICLLPASVSCNSTAVAYFISWSPLTRVTRRRFII